MIINNLKKEKIKSIKKINKSSVVYDITTASHTLLANNILIHNCSGHSVEYVKKNGLKNIPAIPTNSKPAKTATVLARHICSLTQFLSGQFAGAIGWEAINVFFAPFLEGMKYSEIKQLAQTLIFDLSQLAGARGGQVSFTDFNVYASVPKHYEEVYAVGPGGKYAAATYKDGEIDKVFHSTSREEIEEIAKRESATIVRYKNFKKEAVAFAKAMLEVAAEGDADGTPFAFPKINFHINEESFTDQDTIELVKYACEASSKSGCPYFIFDRNAHSVSQCPVGYDEKVLVKSEKTQQPTLSKVGNLELDRIYDVYANGKFVKGLFKKYENQILHVLTLKNKHQITLAETHENLCLINREREELKTTREILDLIEDGNEVALPYTESKFLGNGCDYDTGFLVGAFGGDGSVQNRTVTYSLNQDKKNEGLCQKIIDIATSKFGATYTINKSEDTRLMSLTIHSDFIAGLIREYVEGIGIEKNYKGRIFDKSLEFRQGILDGHTLTDGTIQNRIYTASEKMRDSLIALGTTLGKVSSISVDTREERLGMNPVYCLLFYKATLNTYKDVYKRVNGKIYIPIINSQLELNKRTGYCFTIIGDEPYFNLMNSGILTRNCRLKIDFDADDIKLINTPEELRFVGGQNVSINLPNAALKVKADKEEFFKEIEKRMNYACIAHLNRLEYLMGLANVPNTPLSFYEKGMDGKPYIRYEKISWLIGVVGLNECVYNLIGQELHESNEAYQLGLEIILFMNSKIKELSKEYNLSLKLEETPAEGTATRFAKLDKKHYPNAFIKENEFGVYYTNSIHFAADSDVDYVTRLIKQSKFHDFVEAGSMIHIWGGDNQPSPEAIYELLKRTWYETRCVQWVLSPEYTICKSCHVRSNGLLETCPKCGSEDVRGLTRITGYYVFVDKFISGKRAELQHRKREVIK